MSEITAHLEKDNNYCMDVLFIHENRRTFTKQSVPHYVHDIYMQDIEGKKYKGEYVTTEKTQKDFVAGQKACFKCTYVSTAGEEITFQPQDAAIKGPDKILEPTKWYEGDMTGRPATLALEAASRLGVAEIQATGTAMDDDFVEKMLTVADKIEAWLNAKNV